MTSLDLTKPGDRLKCGAGYLLSDENRGSWEVGPFVLAPFRIRHSLSVGAGLEICVSLCFFGLVDLWHEQWLVGIVAQHEPHRWSGSISRSGLNEEPGPGSSFHALHCIALGLIQSNDVRPGL